MIDRMRHLQQAARALRQAESTMQWTQILADAAAALEASVSFFRVEDGNLICEAARGRAARVAPPVPVGDAIAFQQAIETKEPVVALHAASQLSEPIAASVSPASKRAHLLPLHGTTRVLGVLMVESDSAVDIHAFEVLLALASASLEMRRERAQAPIIAPAAEAAIDCPSARRYAAVTVARWVAEHGSAVANGRSNRNLYALLRQPMDKARTAYKQQFLDNEKTKTDFLHREIVERLARHDMGALGSNYPGPLV